MDCLRDPPALCGYDSIQRHRLYLFCSTFCFIAIYSNYKWQFKIYMGSILSPIAHRLQTLPAILRSINEISAARLHIMLKVRIA